MTYGSLFKDPWKPTNKTRNVIWPPLYVVVGLFITKRELYIILHVATQALPYPYKLEKENEIELQKNFSWEVVLSFLPSVCGPGSSFDLLLTCVGVLDIWVSSSS